MTDDQGALESTGDRVAYAAAGDLAAVRSFVRRAASAAGLMPDRVELLVLAVSELATNTLEHTSSGGLARIWRNDGQIVCEVVDGGRHRPFAAMPASDSRRGRGLAIVRSVVDDVATFDGPSGTVVRLRMNV
jgi:anti-sigma regulatory factor (Ser/Thr protein kinase)